LVAIRPSNGHVLTAATGPGSDGAPTATVGQYAPGSTFKVVSALAFLRAGIAPSDTLTCRPNMTLNGKLFTNYSQYPDSALGQIPLRTAFSESCNTAFIDRQSAASQDDLADAAASLGLGVDYDIGFPAYFG